MKRISLLLAMAMILVAPSLGMADKKKVPDPDDVFGKLDIRAVSHGHGANGKLVHSVLMFEVWASEDLGSEESWISMLFDMDPEGFNDNRYLRIDYSQEDGLYADMYTQGISGPGELIGPVGVSRPTEDSVKVKFPRRYLGKRLKQYRWRAIASYEDEADCSSEEDSAHQGGCLDYQPPPKKPGILHDLR